MPNRKFKIGIDFHGVINDRPEFFSEFCRLAMKRGWEIHVITGGPYQSVVDWLNEYQVPFTNVFAILDFYDAHGEVTHFENGEFKVPDKLWDSAKAEYCGLNGINIHIDDSTKYAQWFITPYCHYDTDKKNCRTASNLKIDFSSSPEQALAEIQQLIQSIQFF